MRRNNWKIILPAIIITLASVNLLNAQQGLSPLGMKIAWPLPSWSPAQAIDTGIVITLPSLYVSGYHTGPNIWKGIERNDNGDPFIDLDQWIDQLDDRNEFLAELELTTLAVSWRNKNNQWGIHHSVRTQAGVNYPKDLAVVLSRGNADFIDQTIDIGPDVNWNSFHEIGLQYAYHKPGKWSIGARIKRLQGLQNIETESSKLTLYTDPEFYQLTFDVDYKFRQAGILTIEDNKAILLEPQRPWRNFSFARNGGWAFDLGASFTVSERVTVQAAVLDMGWIHWQHNAREYASKDVYIYDGIDVKDIIDLDTLNLEAELDSVREKLGFRDTSINYTNSLPLRAMGTVHIKANDNHRFALSGVYRKFEGLDPELGLAIQWNADWFSWLSVGLQYAIQNRQYDHLGINFLIDLKYVQLYGWTDSMLHFGRDRDIHINGGFGAVLSFTH